MGIHDSTMRAAVADFVRVAEFIEIEQFRRQSLAAGVALTLLLIDAYREFC